MEFGIRYDDGRPQRGGIAIVWFIKDATGRSSYFDILSDSKQTCSGLYEKYEIVYGKKWRTQIASVCAATKLGDGFALVTVGGHLGGVPIDARYASEGVIVAYPATQGDPTDIEVEAIRAAVRGPQ